MMRIKQKLSMSNESSGSNQQLNGKDKIKILKLMKAKSTAENPPKASVQHNQDKPSIKEKDKWIEMKDVKKLANNFPVVPKTIKNAIPDDFFDAQSVLPPPSEIIPAIAPKETASNTANIPAGFFDDPIEDLTARGLSIKQQLSRQVEIENAELNTLLTEIDKIDEDTSAVDAELEDEHNVHDFEEASIQMAYITKLAKLYKQSENVISKRGLEVSSSSTQMGNFESALKAAENESMMLLGNAIGEDGVEVRGAAAGTASYIDIGQVVSEKLNELNAASKKRKLEEDDFALQTGKGRRIGDIEKHSDDAIAGHEDEGDQNDGDDSSEDYDPLQFM